MDATTEEEQKKHERTGMSRACDSEMMICVIILIKCV